MRIWIQVFIQGDLRYKLASTILLALADQFLLFGNLEGYASVHAHRMANTRHTWLVRGSPLSALRMLPITTMPILCRESVVLQNLMSP